jgi:hypothetical protein
MLIGLANRDPYRITIMRRTKKEGLRSKVGFCSQSQNPFHLGQNPTPSISNRQRCDIHPFVRLCSLNSQPLKISSARRHSQRPHPWRWLFCGHRQAVDFAMGDKQHHLTISIFEVGGNFIIYSPLV